MSKRGKSKKIGSRLLGEGKWLYLEEIEYVDHNGLPHTWESAARQGGRGAVVIIPRLRPSGRYVCIRQYRPPCDAYTIEFPAGLVDPGEKVEATAVRELREETGYRGTITDISPRVIASAGFSREAFHFVKVDIDETAPTNRCPVQACEINEDIQVILVDPADIATLFAEVTEAGDLLDSRLVAYFLGNTRKS